jgi:hypothetical protein
MSPLHGYRVQPLPEDPEPGRGETADQTWTYGSCLHLSARGGRCERPALEGGFCARHSAEAIDAGPWVWFRRLAALLVAAAILWPIVEAFLDELSHWRH